MNEGTGGAYGIQRAKLSLRMDVFAGPVGVAVPGREVPRGEIGVPAGSLSEVKSTRSCMSQGCRFLTTSPGRFVGFTHSSCSV